MFRWGKRCGPEPAEQDDGDGRLIVRLKLIDPKIKTMQNLKRRIQQLDKSRREQLRLAAPKFEIREGYVVKSLPAAYKGERHLVTVGHEPDGKFVWDERPRPEAPGPGQQCVPATPPLR